MPEIINTLTGPALHKTARKTVCYHTDRDCSKTNSAVRIGTFLIRRTIPEGALQQKFNLISNTVYDTTNILRRGVCVAPCPLNLVYETPKQTWTIHSTHSLVGLRGY